MLEWNMGFDKNHIIFLTIKRRILNGIIPEGKAIDIRILADELIVSPAPIREALIRLSERDLVESYSGRGFFVKHQNTDELVRASCLLIEIIKFSIHFPNMKINTVERLGENLIRRLEDCKIEEQFIECTLYEFIRAIVPTGLLNCTESLTDKTIFMRKSYYQGEGVRRKFLVLIYNLCTLVCSARVQCAIRLLDRLSRFVKCTLQVPQNEVLW